MPSVALTQWRGERSVLLGVVAEQCAATPAGTLLAGENLKAAVVLLSSHLQGYCRDLYTECAQAISSKMRASLQLMVQRQFLAQLALDVGNATWANIRRSFLRLEWDFEPATLLPGEGWVVSTLGDLNAWRNVVAHSGDVAQAPGSLDFARWSRWREACGRLAVSLDAGAYNHLRQVLRRRPWVP